MKYDAAIAALEAFSSGLVKSGAKPHVISSCVAAVTRSAIFEDRRPRDVDEAEVQCGDIDDATPCVFMRVPLQIAYNVHANLENTKRHAANNDITNTVHHRAIDAAFAAGSFMGHEYVRDSLKKKRAAARERHFLTSRKAWVAKRGAVEPRDENMDRDDGLHLGQPLWQPHPLGSVQLLLKPVAALKTDSFSLVVDCSCTGHELQQIIEKQHAIPVCRQMLSLNGRQVQHSDKLSDYSLEHGTEVCTDVHNTQEPHSDYHRKFESEDSESEVSKQFIEATAALGGPIVDVGHDLLDLEHCSESFAKLGLVTDAAVERSWARVDTAELRQQLLGWANKPLITSSDAAL